MAEMPAGSVDSIVTDPPYGLSFMGKGWDHGVPGVEFWEAALRVAKPGAHLLAFGGTRTFHRLTVAIEDAGWEVRDCLMWVYGSGFPKSLDVSKAIDKRGGTIAWQRDFAKHLRSIRPRHIKPSDINSYLSNGSKSNFWGHFIDVTSQPFVPSVEQYRKLRQLLPIDPVWDECFLPEAEREVVGQKEMIDTRKARAGFSGSTHSPDYDGSRRVVDITAPATDAARQWQGWGTALKPSYEPVILARKPFLGTVAANVLEHGTGALNVDGCRVGTEVLPEQRAGQSKLGTFERENMVTPEHVGRWPANLIHDGSEEVVGLMAEAARFFYCAKASKRDRDEGLDSFEERLPNHGKGHEKGGLQVSNSKKPIRNHHPTVKPTDLMRYLCRLVTPPGGLVLDPFGGSGSTGKAALLEGFRVTLCELSEEYWPIIEARCKWAANERPEGKGSAMVQRTLFSGD